MTTENKATTDIDMVTMSIIDSTMTAICREMGVVLMKTSYSTIFNEALDFTCVLGGANGELMAQAEYCPSMIGGVPLLLRSSIKEIPIIFKDRKKGISKIPKIETLRTLKNLFLLKIYG